MRQVCGVSMCEQTEEFYGVQIHMCVCVENGLCLCGWRLGCGDISAGACNRILPNSNLPYSVLEQ